MRICYSSNFLFPETIVWLAANFNLVGSQIRKRRLLGRIQLKHFRHKWQSEKHGLSVQAPIVDSSAFLSVYGKLTKNARKVKNVVLIGKIIKEIRRFRLGVRTRPTIFSINYW